MLHELQAIITSSSFVPVSSRLRSGLVLLGDQHRTKPVENYLALTLRFLQIYKQFTQKQQSKIARQGECAERVMSTKR